MSGTIATPEAGGAPGKSRPGSVLPAPGRRPGWLTPIAVAIAACTLLALGLRLLLLSRPGYLLGVTEYDDGPYFGSAVQLVHGILPYRSFILVQPPGITLLMTPSALLSLAIGTSHALATGRLLTTLASTAGVLLTGLLVRHRGLLAVIVSCGIVAVYPDSVLTARTVLVEPWLTMFCLLGALAVFDAGRLTASRRRLLWGGIAFGFAGCVEVWAIFPVLVLAMMMLRQFRRHLAFAAGVAAGFVVPALPFAVLAPKGFYQSLYVAQVAPRAGSTRIPLGARLSHILGVVNIHFPAHPLAILVCLGVLLAAIIAAMMAAAWLLSHRPPPPLDTFVVMTCLVIVSMFIWPDQFHYHFTVFLAPFLAASLGLAVARLLDAGTQRSGAPGTLAGQAGLPATALAALIVVGFAINQAYNVMHMALPFGPVPARVQQIIPKNTCIATDQVSYLLLANRFSPDLPQCPRMLDGLGSDLAFSNGLKPGTGAALVPAVRELWADEFRRSQFVWLSYNAYRRVAWTPGLRAYLARNFVLVLKHGWHDSLYERRGLRTG